MTAATGEGGTGGGDAAAAAAAAAAAGGSGGETPWYSDTQKDFVTAKGWKTPTEAIDSYTNLERLIGADKAGRTIVLPKDANDVEGTKAFRAKLGVPEKAEDYKLPVPEGQDPALATWASSEFHRLGVPTSAAQGFVEAWNKKMGEMVAANTAADEAAVTEDMTKLKTALGAQYPVHEEMAKRVITQFGKVAGLDQETIASIAASIGKSSNVFKLFAAMGKSIGEHGFAAGDGSGNTFSANKQAIQKQVDELKQKRISGAISERDYFAQMERLGPLLESAA